MKNLIEFLTLHGFLDSLEVFATALQLTLVSILGYLVSFHSGALTLRGSLVIGWLLCGAAYLILPDIINIGIIDDLIVMLATVSLILVTLSRPISKSLYTSDGGAR